MANVIPLVNGTANGFARGVLAADTFAIPCATTIVGGATVSTGAVTVSAGSIGIGTNPTSVTGIGNPVLGANNLIGYNAGNIGLFLLTDGSTRTQEIGFGAAGLSTFDAGMQYTTASRGLNFYAGAASVATLATTGNLTLNGSLTAAGATFSNGIFLTYSATNSVVLYLNNTLSGAHDWALGSCGSAGPASLGDFIIYDNTAAATRVTVDTSGNMILAAGLTVAGGSTFNGTPTVNTSSAEVDFFMQSANSSAYRIYFSNNASSNLFAINYTTSAGAFNGSFIQGNTSTGALTIPPATTFNSAVTFSGAINANGGSIASTASTLTVSSAGNLILQTSTNNNGKIQFNPTDFYPLADNGIALGGSSNRWSTVYAAVGTINTSDAREKTPLSPFSSEELSAASDILDTVGLYQWLADPGQFHIGVLAQQLTEIFERWGLDWHSYGMISYEKDRYGLRYDQLNLFLNRSLHERLKWLESKFMA